MAVLTGRLIDRVAEILTRYNMLPAGSRVGVAVSGGADSVALLHIFAALRQSFQIEPVILHVNHHLRGTESEEDEGFVRSLAVALNLECLVEDAQVEGGNLEQAARDARRAFFLRVMEEEDRMYPVALGHTQSDQAETVLFRLLRGTGLTGMAGMQISDPCGLIRPLLTTSRKEVREWAVANGVTWREDSSNNDLRFSRNRLRNELIPLITEYFNSNLEGTLASTALVAQAEENYWNEAIEPFYREITKRTWLGLILNVTALRGLHLAVQRRVIRRTLLEVKGDLRGLNADHVAAVLALCRREEGHDRVLIPGADALRSFDRLLVTKPGTLGSRQRHYRVEVAVGGEYVLPFHSGLLCVSQVNDRPQICVNFKEDQKLGQEVAFLDGDELGRHGCLVARNWEPGDQMLRPGHRSAEKLKSLFQEHRVLLWERRHWPVLMSGDRVAWVRGFGTAADFENSGRNGETVRILYRAEV